MGGSCSLPEVRNNLTHCCNIQFEDDNHSSGKIGNIKVEGKIKTRAVNKNNTSNDKTVPMMFKSEEEQNINKNTYKIKIKNPTNDKKNYSLDNSNLKEFNSFKFVKEKKLDKDFVSKKIELLSEPEITFNINLLNIINQARENPKTLSESINNMKKLLVKMDDKFLFDNKDKGFFILKKEYDGHECFDYSALVVSKFLATEKLKYDPELNFLLPNSYELLKSDSFIKALVSKNSNLKLKNYIKYSFFFCENLLDPLSIVVVKLLDLYPMFKNKSDYNNGINTSDQKDEVKVLSSNNEIEIIQKKSFFFNSAYTKFGVAYKKYSCNNHFCIFIVLAD